MGGGVLKKFAGPSALSIGSAVLNMLTTIYLIRWFGSEIYSVYIVDLAKLSLLFVVLEFLPTSYSVFRVQDDPAWGRSIAAHVFISTIFLFILVFALGRLTTFFGNYSFWIAFYVIVFSFRRYVDIRLQSSGRLKDYMKIELFSAVLRLAFMAIWLFSSLHTREGAWATLVLGGAISQLLWWARNREEATVFAGVIEKETWVALKNGFSDYLPYYFGVVLKRLKDNFVPLVADIIFSSRDMLAAFFLAQRGLLFAVGQIRIFEALLNHRDFLEKVSAISVFHQSLVAIASQLVCLIASFVLVTLSGVPVESWSPVILFSFVVWPVVFFVIDRAKAYADYGAMRVNLATLSHLLVGIVGAVGVMNFVQGEGRTVAFISVLFLSESTACYVIKRVGQRGSTLKNRG